MPKDLDKIIEHLDNKQKISKEDRLSEHKQTYFFKSLELLFVAVLFATGATFNLPGFDSIFFSGYFLTGSLMHGLYYPFFVKPDSESMLNTILFLCYNSVWSYIFSILFLYELFVFLIKSKQ